MALRDYLAIARPNHWFKNIFMLPGFIIALAAGHAVLSDAILLNIALSVLAACLLASANYTINEWLDAETDLHHAMKKNRPSVLGNVSAGGVYVQWLALAATGLAIASRINPPFFYTSAFFLLMGLIYNVPPMRTKDRQYLDVLTEAVNNPIRLLLGWCAIVSNTLPPSSFLVAYWMGGAFLMAVKRYSEFRFIDDRAKAALYRKSFGHYSEKTLLLSAFFYALTASFLLGVFLIKYRVEFILCVPFISVLFVWYLHIGMRDESIAQSPEKLYLYKGFSLFVLFLTFLLILLSFVNIPWLNILLLPVRL